MPKSIKILLLEDEPIYTDILIMGLQQEGFEADIVEVATKKMFVDQLNGSTFDVIITDYTLPDINGMEAVQIVMKLVPDTPVVVFTGSVGEETAIACLKAGAADYVLKQNPIRLIPATMAALEKARAEGRLKESEDALRTSNSEIRALVENSPDIIIRFDRNLRHSYVNPAIQVKMGIPAAAFIGKTHEELGLPAEISAYWQQHLHDVFESGKEKVIEFDFPSPDGLTHYQSRLVPESTLIGSVETVLVIARDITERKRGEDKLKESERKYRQLVEALQEGIWVIDKDAYTTFVNPHMAQMLGYTVSEMQGKHLFSFMDEAGIEIAKKNLERRKQGIKELHEFELLTKNGGRVLTTMEAAPILDERNEYIGAIAGVTDITERKLAENALHASEKKYRELVDNLGEVIYEINSAGDITFINPAIRRLSGYKPVRIVGKNLTDLIYQGDRDLLLKRLGELKQGKEHISEYRIISKSGEVRWIETSSKTIMEGNKYIGARGTLVDITDRKRVEKALHESEDRFRNLVENITDVFYVLDPEGKLIYGSPNLFSESGYAPHELIGKSYVRLIAPVDQRRVVDYYVAQTKLGVLDASCEFRGLRKDGVILWTEQRTRIVRDGAGKVIQYRNVLRNVTDRKRAEEALLEKEERFRNLVENITDVFFVFDSEGKLTYASPNLLAEIGYSPDEMKGKSYVRLVAPVDRRRVVDYYVAQTRLGAPDTACECRALRKDGVILWAELRTRVVRDSAGHVTEFRTVIRNITERKLAEEASRKAEAALHESEKKYRELVENLSDVIYEINPRGEITFINPAIRRVLGYEPVELVGKSVFDLVYQDDRDFLLKRLGELKQGIEYPLEYRAVSKTGDIRWIRTWSKPIKDGNTFVGARGTLVDITERKRAENALHESEERFRNLVENITDVFYISGPDGKLIYGSPNLFTELGYTPDEIIGRLYVRLVAPVDRRRVIDYYVTQTRLGVLDAACEFRALRKDGGILWAEQRTRIVRDGAGKVIENRNVIRNVTERKKAEEALQKSETRFRTLFEQAGVGVAVIETGTGRFAEINEKYCDILGYTKEEMLWTTFQAVTYPDDLQADLDNMELLRQGAIRTFSIEKRYLHKNGRIVWVNLTVSPLWKSGRPIDFHVAVVEDITASKQAQEIARTYAERLQALSKQLLEIQENERSMIARELHDEIGQSLTRVKILLEMDKRGKADGVGQNLREAAELTGGLISRVRDLSLDLRPPMLDDLGLVPAIRSHFLHHTQNMGLGTKFSAEPEEMHFSREIEMTCFRIVQEAVTNTLKHSRAKSIAVQLKRCETNLELSVRDDGTGFDVETAFRQSAEGKSFGLLGMQERVRIAGGIFTIDSGRGRGSEVHAEFPNVFAVSVEGSERKTGK